ncbi:MAG TPA: trehalose-6-phosphate synthase [Candidatus Eisenbacteria bacterium]|nr:trehalose-6-phosphate synthase [Candidatus Eisenbacteria bacterium]
MRLLSARLIISLIIGITLVSLCTSYYQVLMLQRRMRGDLDHRAEVLGDSLASNVQRDLDRDAQRTLQKTVQQFANREHLAGLAVYDPQGHPIAVTTTLEPLMQSAPPIVLQSLQQNHAAKVFARMGTASIHIYALPLHHDDTLIGSLAIVHDSGYIHAEGLRIWRETFLSAVVHVVLIVLITLLIVRWSIAGPIARTAHWIKALRTGRAMSARIKPLDLDLFKPLAREVATLAESLNTARSAAELEARLRNSGQSIWTAERLAVHVRSRLEDGRLFVVSNREPYTHVRRGKSIEVSIPASGLVTAIEPVLCACGGTWVAHGSGDADTETVDERDRLLVPPDDPHYTLRRVWLSKEEEEGYYYGFANEGLWPLCHIAHTRPLFRADDWEHYQTVNRKFATALVEEMEGIHNPVVLVQDYHFALLPRMIKQRRPDARVAIFWHIPWPNPEAFGICPWQRELVDGLLGADLVGFHIQAHCTNFLQTVDRIVESRIDWDHSTVQRHEHLTTVHPFPISVELADVQVKEPQSSSAYEERTALFKSLGVDAALLGLGVDRLDYTKGILERFLAVERFLEKYPRYQGVFSFVQIGAPSRTHIKRYHDLQAEVEAEAERINWKFQADRWKPIILLERHHDHHEILPYYRSADLCLVTSLHDGMNLVAKEFVATRQDERGVLILSCFTGAARELRDALQVNPYDIDQTAEAIRAALEMSPEEKQMRMQRMRKDVREHNVYRWAASLIGEVCDIRLDPGESGRSRFATGASVG